MISVISGPKSLWRISSSVCLIIFLRTARPPSLPFSLVLIRMSRHSPPRWTTADVIRGQIIRLSDVLLIMFKLILIFVFFVPLVGNSPAACFTGRVMRVIDGDTIVVWTNRVRLAEIDAPEMRTAEGPASKAALAKLIDNKIVVVHWWKRGKYRRIIGYVYLQGEI